MDYTVDRWINRVLHHHPLAASAVADFANWGVVLFGILAVGLWVLSSPHGDDRYKRACACGLSAAALGLLANQAIIAVWQRPRPYESHAQLIPLLARSHDPSFPSDHASAAFGIAFGVLFVARRPGLVFLAYAILIGASRVLAGMHYPTDVLAGALIGLAAAILTTRLYDRLLAPAVRLVSRVTDPLIANVARLPIFRQVVLQPRLRAGLIGMAGALVVLRIAFGVRAEMFDEMGIAILLAVIAAVVFAVFLASLRYWATSLTVGVPRRRGRDE